MGRVGTPYPPSRYAHVPIYTFSFLLLLTLSGTLVLQWNCITLDTGLFSWLPLQNSVELYSTSNIYIFISIITYTIWHISITMELYHTGYRSSLLATTTELSSIYTFSFLLLLTLSGTLVLQWNCITLDTGLLSWLPLQNSVELYSTSNIYIFISIITYTIWHISITMELYHTGYRSSLLATTTELS